MSRSETQTLANHARFVPGYHFVSAGLLAVYLLWCLYRVVVAPSLDTAMALAFAVSMGLLFYYARIFSLTLQDRVIRLEERLRLARLLPAELAGEIERLRPRQLVALRFASDGEVEGLVRRVLAGELAGAAEIKREVRSWRSDHLRA
jgi:hypothetical protein